MKYFTVSPSPALARMVRFFWVLEHDVQQNEPYFHKTMADGCAELIFHYKGTFDEVTDADLPETSFTAGIHGPTRHFRRFRIHEGFGIFGVYLYPYAISALFGVPATEVADQMPDLRSFFGNEGVELEEKIYLAQTTGERVQILTGFLEKCLQRRQQYEPAVFSAISQVIRKDGLVSLSDLASQSSLSTRQFERKFKDFAGFSPKLFSRIIRFQATLQAYGDQERSLTEIAIDTGYYDQAHFIHEFRAFSGEHPKKFFSGNVEGNGYRDV